MFFNIFRTKTLKRRWKSKKIMATFRKNVFCCLHLNACFDQLLGACNNRKLVQIHNIQVQTKFWLIFLAFFPFNFFAWKTMKTLILSKCWSKYTTLLKLDGAKKLLASSTLCTALFFLFLELLQRKSKTCIYHIQTSVTSLHGMLLNRFWNEKMLPKYLMLNLFI